MIKQVNANSVNIKNKTQPNEPSFKGLESVGSGLLTAIQMCEANPMLNVTVLDVSTAIAPRTIVEGQTNPYAGLEALRRESSGLIINCLIPGFIVAGMAKLAQPIIMGKGSNMDQCWANEDTINVVSKYWTKAGDGDIPKVTIAGKEFAANSPEARIHKAHKLMLEDISGADGDKTIHFAEAFKKDENKAKFNEALEELTQQTIEHKRAPMVFSKDWRKNRADRKEEIKTAKEAAKKAGKEYVEETPFSKIVGLTNVSENIKIKGHSAPNEYFSQGLGSLLENSKKILNELSKGADPKQFVEKATSLVTKKSILGLGVIIPLALAAQPINRWITAKTSGKKGAPIYKDFENSKNKELSGSENAALWRQKLISISTMGLVALASIGKVPNKAMIKNIFQFKGIFPSMDQARVISTATFMSRMMASEDKNDLREATVRDIATFSAFYFLGDYVAKAAAIVFEKCNKSKIVLINQLKEPPKDANIIKQSFKKALHWAKDTALKSSDELPTKQAKNFRAGAQLVNITFSLLALGLFIPLWNRHQTNKKHEAELKAKALKAETKPEAKEKV